MTILRYPAQKIGIVLAGLALLVGAGWAAFQESSPYFTDSLSETDRISAFIDGTSLPGLAITTQTAYLLTCYDLMRSATLAAEGTQRNQDLTQTCHNAAQHLASQTQANPLAWFVLAFAAAKAGNLNTMSAALRNSYMTGPNEQWIAQLRLPLAEANRVRLAPDLQQWGDRDLENIARTRAGVAGIAHRYSNDPTFRERLTSLVEQFPPAEQRQFVSNLRRALQSAASQQP